MSETLKEKKERLLKELQETESKIKEVDKFDFTVEKQDDLYNVTIFKGDETGGQTWELNGLNKKDLIQINAKTFKALGKEVNEELEDTWKDFHRFFERNFPLRIRW
jgi:hypothetical protein